LSFTVTVVYERNRFVGHDLAQYGGDRLALGKPLPPQPSQGFRGFRLVERNKAGHPAIGEVLVVERIEDSRSSEVRKPKYSQGAQMMFAQHRLQSAGKRCIDQQGVEIHRSFRHDDRMAMRRDRAMEIGQRFRIIESTDFRHKA
jgi:hypothetical protein